MSDRPAPTAHSGLLANGFMSYCKGATNTSSQKAFVVRICPSLSLACVVCADNQTIFPLAEYVLEAISGAADRLVQDAAAQRQTPQTLEGMAVWQALFGGDEGKRTMVSSQVRALVLQAGCEGALSFARESHDQHSSDVSSSFVLRELALLQHLISSLVILSHSSSFAQHLAYGPTKREGERESE